MRRFAAPLATFFALIGLALFAASCGENQHLAGPSDQPTPGLIPGSPAFLPEPDLQNIGADDLAALSALEGAGKAHSSDCNEMWGWWRSSDASPPYWYATRFVDRNGCVTVDVSYTWKVQFALRNIGNDGDDPTTYHVIRGTADTLYTATLYPDENFISEWKRRTAGSYKVTSSSTETAGASIAMIRLTETWRNTD